jgi:aspartyl-tRNA(Asn)/glutamyl-tRNA(Gln) amidotransferase subunit A
VFNVTGHPAITLMCGLAEPEQLPLSVQLAGRYFEEARLYQAAAAYERAAPWRDRHPA